MSRKDAKQGKNHGDMTLDELRAATAEFDQPTPGRGLPGKPLTAAERQKFETWRRGRPRRGEGAQVISLTVEKGLLRRADAQARREKISRARLVERGLRLVLRQAKA